MKPWLSRARNYFANRDWVSLVLLSNPSFSVIWFWWALFCCGKSPVNIRIIKSSTLWARNENPSHYKWKRNFGKLYWFLKDIQCIGFWRSLAMSFCDSNFLFCWNWWQISVSGKSRSFPSVLLPHSDLLVQWPQRVNSSSPGEACSTEQAQTTTWLVTQSWSWIQT